MTDASYPMQESLVSFCADDDNFYATVSNIQGLYHYLQHNPSPQCEENYLKLMANLLENYLDTSKQLVLRQHLSTMIARYTKDEYAAQYFKQRFARAKILDLLKHHRSLTGKQLILTHIDYQHQKFKLQTC